MGNGVACFLMIRTGFINKYPNAVKRVLCLMLGHLGSSLTDSQQLVSLSKFLISQDVSGIICKIGEFMKTLCTTFASPESPWFFLETEQRGTAGGWQWDMERGSLSRIHFSQTAIKG